MKLLVSIILLTSPLADIAQSQNPAMAPGAVVSSTDVLAKLLQWLPGDYTNTATLGLPSINDAQAVTDKDLLTTYIRQVELPRFGEAVLFLEEYRGAQANKLERVRLYVFEHELNSGQVTLRLRNPKEPEALKGARNNVHRLQALTLADVTVDRSACTLTFNALPNGTIVGRMQTRACDVPANWVDYELHVGPDGHWVCYSRRTDLNDTISWQSIPSLPCVLMSRVN